MGSPHRTRYAVESDQPAPTPPVNLGPEVTLEKHFLPLTRRRLKHTCRVEASHVFPKMTNLSSTTGLWTTDHIETTLTVDQEKVGGNGARLSNCSGSRLICIRREPLLALGYGELRNVDAQLMFDTWEWTANLGAPAALVAGAVLATMVESREAMSPKKSDTQLMRVAKKLCRFLLLSSFGLEVVSIFVTTVTGTMLLSHGDTPGTLKNLAYNSPMGFLKNNWEFEYLTARIAFLQGLFHWLASVALELYIPKEAEGVAARRMNKFTSSALATILVGMLSFLNRHMTFYKNYAHMLRCYVVVSFKMFFWPPHPLTILMAPMTIITLVLGFQAFMTSGDMEKD